MKKTRFFFKRSQKVVLSGQKNQIVIPFRPLTVIALLLLLFSSVFLLLRSDIFIIHKTWVEGEGDCVSEEGVTQNIDLLGRSIFFANYERSKENIMKTFPCLGNVYFRKQFPDKITVELNLRTPVALVYEREDKESTTSAQLATASAQISTQSADAVIPSATESARFFFLVDKEGVLFSQDEANLPLPKVETSPNYSLSIGKRIEEKSFKTLLGILVESGSLGITISGGKIGGDKIMLVTNEGVQVIMAGKKDPNFQVKSLQAILTQTKIEGVILEKIDFSFEKPVLTTRKK